MQTEEEEEKTQAGSPRKLPVVKLKNFTPAEQMKRRGGGLSVLSTKVRVGMSADLKVRLLSEENERLKAELEARLR
jgi:hypothetical protein